MLRGRRDARVSDILRHAQARNRCYFGIGMVKFPHAVPGQPTSNYGCTGTAEAASNHTLHEELIVSNRRQSGRRRARVVIGGIIALVGILAVYDIISNISEDNSFADYTSILVDTSSTTLTVTGQPTAQDVADCASFTGWLQTDCLQSKVTDRKSVSVWTDDQVREAKSQSLDLCVPRF